MKKIIKNEKKKNEKTCYQEDRKGGFNTYSVYWSIFSESERKLNNRKAGKYFKEDRESLGPNF